MKYKVILSIILLFSTQMGLVILPTSASDSNIEKTIHDILRCSEEGAQREAILSIDEPEMVDVSEATSFLEDGEEILGIEINGEYRAYPLKIMRWHEIVNDQSELTNIAMTYCPLTGTGINYNTSQIGGSELGVTGFLFENNLVFYDRDTNSCWVQMLGTSMSGERLGEQLQTISVRHTTFKSWKSLHPNTIVLSDDTGMGRDYDNNIYEGYEESDSILYASNYITEEEPYNWYHAKEKTLIVNHLREPHLFPFIELEKTSVVNFEINNQSSVIIYDSKNSFWSVFRPQDIQGRELNMVEGERDSLGFLTMSDQFNRTWNILGNHNTLSLEEINAYQGYWFAAITLFPDGNVFTNQTLSDYNAPSQSPNVHVTTDNISIFLRYFLPIFIIITVSFLLLDWKVFSKLNTK